MSMRIALIAFLLGALSCGTRADPSDEGEVPTVPLPSVTAPTIDTDGLHTDVTPGVVIDGVGDIRTFTLLDSFGGTSEQTAVLATSEGVVWVALDTATVVSTQPDVGFLFDVIPVPDPSPDASSGDAVVYSDGDASVFLPLTGDTTFSMDDAYAHQLFAHRLMSVGDFEGIAYLHERGLGFWSASDDSGSWRYETTDVVLPVPGNPPESAWLQGEDLPVIAATSDIVAGDLLFHDRVDDTAPMEVVGTLGSVTRDLDCHLPICAAANQGTGTAAIIVWDGVSAPTVHSAALTGREPVAVSVVPSGEDFRIATADDFGNTYSVIDVDETGLVRRLETYELDPACARPRDIEWEESGAVLIACGGLDSALYRATEHL